MAFYSGKIVKEKVRKPSKLIPILVLLLLAAGGGSYVALQKYGVLEKIPLYRCYWDNSVSTIPANAQTGVRSISIEPGQDTLSIGQALVKKGIILNATDFLCYVRKIDAGNKIQAGYYEITLPVSLEQLVPLFQSARIPTVRVTLQEGLRMDEIAAKIQLAMGTESEIVRFSVTEFMNLATDKTVINALTYTKGKTSLEGFLFPDTYEIAKNATSKDVIDLLVNTFLKKVAVEPTFNSPKTFTPYQVVVMASLVEKEAGKSLEEKQMVAGILEKRIKSNWLIQVDAALLYEKKDWKATITSADLATISPYNTYKAKGLPPTPICNPGLESIQAVLTSKDSPYWFYSHGKDGVIHYARTNAEHEQNKSLYLR